MICLAGRPGPARTLQACSAALGLGQGELALGPGRVWTELTSATHALGGRGPALHGARSSDGGRSARGKLMSQNHLLTSDEPRLSLAEVCQRSRLRPHTADDGSSPGTPLPRPTVTSAQTGRARPPRGHRPTAVRTAHAEPYVTVSESHALVDVASAPWSCSLRLCSDVARTISLSETETQSITFPDSALISSESWETPTRCGHKGAS